MVRSTMARFSDGTLSLVAIPAAWKEAGKHRAEPCPTWRRVSCLFVL